MISSAFGNESSPAPDLRPQSLHTAAWPLPRLPLTMTV
ncbi:hypothetical protein FOQG_18597 [Fusarium oxysporum f. sp. raphani 54005]|uniref:Uncharacterized protein n=1 Tax=Fusarium oxysporum f. sp. raphani 54005 TaxID=1089458 RepID=X0BCZ3_FUSOX|nr:hypothetical protein FOQG_18597 [Fusarium oxysporum f. sp. raphani 54005]